MARMPTVDPRPFEQTLASAIKVTKETEAALSQAELAALRAQLTDRYTALYQERGNRVPAADDWSKVKDGIVEGFVSAAERARVVESLRRREQDFVVDWPVPGGPASAPLPSSGLPGIGYKADVRAKFIVPEDPEDLDHLTGNELLKELRRGQREERRKAEHDAALALPSSQFRRQWWDHPPTQQSNRPKIQPHVLEAVAEERAVTALPPPVAIVEPKTMRSPASDPPTPNVTPREPFISPRPPSVRVEKSRPVPYMPPPEVLLEQAKPDTLRDAAKSSKKSAFKQAVDECAKRIIEDALERNEGDRAATAKELGVARSTIYYTLGR